MCREAGTHPSEAESADNRAAAAAPKEVIRQGNQRKGEGEFESEAPKERFGDGVSHNHVPVIVSGRMMMGRHAQRVAQALHLWDDIGAEAVQQVLTLSRFPRRLRGRLLVSAFASKLNQNVVDPAFGLSQVTQFGDGDRLTEQESLSLSAAFLSQ